MIEGAPLKRLIIKRCASARGAESWWGCFDSDSDSGLLVGSDSGFDSDSGPDAKYKINNTLIVKRISAVQAKKKKEKEKKRDISY